jgi:hypothetical protein
MNAEGRIIQLKSESECNAVRAQLERILEDRLFRSSKLYPSFLRYVVTRTLEGRAEHLKERTIGIEVFGRKPDYDTALDSVVRVTAGQVRKRLAQYYQNPQHRNETIIDLLPGGYTPVLHYPEKEPVSAPITPVSRRRIPLWVILGFAGLAIAVVLFGWIKLSAPQITAFEKFWAPVLRSQNQIILCTGSAEGLARQLANTKKTNLEPIQKEGTRRLIALDEAAALMEISYLLKARGKSYRLRDESSLTITDLKAAPVILIGSVKNLWTLREVAPLRYSFQLDAEANMIWISDREHPNNRNWSQNLAVLADSVTEDCALISRFLDRTTGQYSVVLAGLYRFGTLAASEFVSDPSLLAELDSVAPRGWEKMNLEAVIATKVLEGNPARPRIVASYFW